MSTQPVPFVRPHAAWALVGWLALCFTVGGVASTFNVHEIPTWYKALVKPPLNPPTWVFPLVWTALYALMAVAVWLIWKTRASTCRISGQRLFLAQLLFNFLWSWIFFSQHQIATAVVDIVLLWVAILLCILNFKKMSHKAAWLMVPYLAWVTFAAYLNIAIWRLN
ncbi:MAG TPA: TspO/MBR family protein [Acidobacteriaceae bacterium]|nr:TspO/MBR family protein [Acidobacteriaceae bacterium]